MGVAVVGCAVGLALGEKEGCAVGLALGEKEGYIVGNPVGEEEGALGIAVGCTVVSVGECVSTCESNWRKDGAAVVGYAVGISVVDGAHVGELVFTARFSVGAPDTGSVVGVNSSMIAATGEKEGSIVCGELAEGDCVVVGVSAMTLSDSVVVVLELLLPPFLATMTPTVVALATRRIRAPTNTNLRERTFVSCGLSWLSLGLTVSSSSAAKLSIVAGRGMVA